jgi:hypothetical protein
MNIEPRLLSFEEADQVLDGVLSRTFEGSYETVALFEGNLELEDDFRTQLEAKIESADLVVVSGDLTVRGDIALYDRTPGLYVKGTTTADSLQGGDCEIYIHDGTFKYLVYGEYNNGILDTGTVSVPWVINSDHDLRVNAENARQIDAYGEDPDVDFRASELPEAFVPEVLDEDGNLDIGAVLEHLRAAKPVLLSEV